MRENAYTNNQDLLNWIKTPDSFEFTEKGYPILQPSFVDITDCDFIPFNQSISFKGNKEKTFVHFYIQDYLFNRIWNDPTKYIDVLKNYKGIVMPDFSLFTDMPLPLQQFNYYKNLWFAAMCQDVNIEVIPNACWSNEQSYDFCFEGIPNKSTIMLSTLGSTRRLEARELFYSGMFKMLEVLEPERILLRTTANQFEKIKNEIKEKCNSEIIFIKVEQFFQ